MLDTGKGSSEEVDESYAALVRAHMTNGEVVEALKLWEAATEEVSRLRIECSLEASGVHIED